MQCEVVFAESFIFEVYFCDFTDLKLALKFNSENYPKNKTLISGFFFRQNTMLKVSDVRFLVSQVKTFVQHFVFPIPWGLLAMSLRL